MKAFKIIGGIAVIIIICLLVYKGAFYYKYNNALKKQNEYYVESIYKDSLFGIIRSIEKRESDSNIYLIELVDTSNYTVGVGYVEITNFSQAEERDSVIKKTNSFELEIKGKNGHFKSLIKYKL